MSSRTDFSKDRTFLIDLTKCTACRGCQVACKSWNELAGEKTDFFSGEGYENPRAMSEYTYTRIKFVTYVKHGQNEYAFIKEMCMHCNDPACASVCPVAAFYKTEEGPVVYRSERCIGCRFCMIACPFGVPKYEWSKALPLVKKCTGCYSRVREGLWPACAKTCPTAITYGSREEMFKEAKRRLALHPGRYVPKIYGKEEAGGTSVLYLSALPFDELGFREVTTRPLPEYTWQALRFVPAAFFTVGIGLSAVAWITHRRERLEKEQKAQPEKNQSAESKEDKK
jgi:formate dehydrogenase iron-sulfur subunit